MTSTNAPGQDQRGRLSSQQPPPRGSTGYAAAEPPTSAWTAGRVTALVLGSLLILMAIPIMAVGGIALVVDQLRDDDGYVSFGTQTYSTSGYAIASETIELRGIDTEWGVAQTFIGTVRVRVTPEDDKAIFVGIAPAADAAQYLDGVERLVVSGPNLTGSRTLPGDAPGAPPEQAGIWTEQVTDAGQQTLNWSVRDGDWTVVIMNADGSAGVNVRSHTAATVPALFGIGLGVLITGVVLFALGLTAVVIAVRRASRTVPNRR